MSANVAPNIVRNGLVLELDAANTKSYPGTGTSWTDLTANGNNGSLINSPTFSSANGGSIVFNGTNNYVDCGNNTSLQINQGTILAWVKTTTPGSGYRSIITKQNNYAILLLDSVLITYDWGNSATRTTGINIANGNWRHVCMTFTDNTGTPSNNARIYIDGSLVFTTTIKIQDNSINLEIARGGPQGGGPTQLISGNIASAQIYNRALSATEVLQNYNALKSRFGL